MLKKTNYKPKVIVVLGATSTGKSDIAVKLAKKFNGEVISADSRQVYKGLDIGTGKITPDTKNSSNFSTGQVKKKGIFTHKRIPHYLIDVANPKRKFTVTQYKKLADKKIKEIIARGKVPIICGGTGFYIDAVVNNTVFPEVPPNSKLRKELGLKTDTELFRMLKKLDPKRAKSIDSKNKIRLIRALEIAKAIGKTPLVKVEPSQYEFIKIGLKLPDDVLDKKIMSRLLFRIKGGMLNEAKRLHKNGLSLKRMQELGLEYKYMALFLSKKISKNEMIAELYTKILQYAKRQKTWWKRDREITWLSPKDYNQIENMIKKIL